VSFTVTTFTHFDETDITLTLGNRRRVPVPHPERFEAGETQVVNILVDRVPRFVTFFYRPTFDTPRDDEDPEIPSEPSPRKTFFHRFDIRTVYRITATTTEGLTIDDISIDSDPV